VATIFASSAATADLDPREHGFACTSRYALRENYRHIDSVIISPKDITYLAREGNKMACGIKESIYARALDPPSTGVVDCDIYSRTHMIALSQPPYDHRNPHRPVLLAPQHPPSTSTTLDLKADCQDPATASCASHLSMPAAMRHPGRPRKDTATAVARAPLAATASATPLPAPPTHVMTTRTLRAGAEDAPSPTPGTQAS
jgi:hypothetical protein